MTPEIYAEWLRRQGRRVLRTASSYWQSEGLGVYQAFPYHWLIQPSADELHELMSKHHALALRYSTAPGKGDQSAGYHAVCTAADYDFGILTPKARNNVRRGLRSSVIDRIPIERYAEEGWKLRVDTLARQERRVKESQAGWRQRTLVARDLEGFEVWAARVEDQLAATLFIFRMEDWLYLVHQQCHRDYLREQINNALTFVVTRELIRRPNVRGIFYGLRSLDAPSSVDTFKFHMGYEARPACQPIVLNRCLRPWINRFTYRVSKTLVALNPGNRRLAKAEGMLREYLGQRSHSPSYEKPHSEPAESDANRADTARA